MSPTKHALLEAISPSRSGAVQDPENVQLIQSMADEHCYALNGIEGYAGMKWGELQKWKNNPMNTIKLQPSLLAILKRKDLLLLPTSKMMLEMQDYITYNDEHPNARIHFLKRFPPGVYEYTLVPTVYLDPIFARNTDGDIVEHSAPYFDSLVFKSDAHPWLVAAFAAWQLYDSESRRGASFAFENQFPIGDYHTASTCVQPLHFYRKPYLGWTPRYMPYRIEEQLGSKGSGGTPSLTSSSSSSSSSSASFSSSCSELSRPCKRAKLDNRTSSSLECLQKQRISAWRCHVVPADDIYIASDERLRAYAMEAARLVRDALGHDPIYQKFMTTSKIATRPSSSLRRKRPCPNVH